jgi:hypothetical protein
MIPEHGRRIVHILALEVSKPERVPFSVDGLELDFTAADEGQNSRSVPRPLCVPVRIGPASQNEVRAMLERRFARMPSHP